MSNLKVIIPLKTNSERVRNKNLRVFYNGNSLFDIKAKQLLNVFRPEDVYVSSENEQVETLVRKYGFNFHLRDAALTGKNTIETELVQTLVNVIPDKDCDIMWCQVTQPLFDEFSQLVETYMQLPEEYDSIVVAQSFRHHLIDDRGNPINFNFGYWHKLSQDLPKIYQVAWAAFIMKRQMLERAWYQIGRKPFIFNTSKYLVDIDTEEDFKLAQVIYKELNGEHRC